MKPNLLTHAMGALLVCVGVSACGEQGTARQEAQAPYVAPETTTTPAQQPEDMTAQTDPYDTATEPYATAPHTEEIDAMTDDPDVADTQTTGDTLGDRCAGLSGPPLTDCLEAERLRRQDMEDPTRLQDQDMPQQ